MTNYATTATNANGTLRVLRRAGQATTRIAIGNGDLVLGGDDEGFAPLVIAGPCSVESYEQVVRIALGVKAAGAHMLRGGAFKPRTSPYAFRGLGEEGLDYLAAARAKTGLPIVTEVTSVADVDLVADCVDVLQIGARNMQHFALLEACGARTRKPVLLKRGIAATVDEWLYAAEYILAAGNPHVILCERGIRTYEPSTRFTLDLGGMLAAKARTHLPIIVDPSHAAGRRDYVAPLARAAIAAGASGLLVEVHDHPEVALSDGDQALTLDDFAALMATLPVTPVSSSSSSSSSSLSRDVSRRIPSIVTAPVASLAAIRGAISVPRNTKREIEKATRELLASIVTLNGITPDEVVSAIFTVTDDLDASFPATVARRAGWGDAALLDTRSINVPGAPKRIIRVLVLLRTTRERPLSSVYLRDAENLRAQIEALLGKTDAHADDDARPRSRNTLRAV